MDEEMTGSLRQVEHTHGHYILGKYPTTTQSHPGKQMCSTM